MRVRGTLILLVLCAVLAAYVFLVDRRQPSRDERDARARVVLRFDPDQATGIRFAFRESTLALARHDGRWAIVEPLAAPADDEAVGALLAELDSLTAERRIPAAEVDIAATGLAAPWLRLAITVADSTHDIAIGDLNPVASAYYARVDAGADLSLLPRGLVDAILRPTLPALRDRRLAPFDPAAARRIELATAEHTLELTAANGEWRIRRPPLRADQDAVGTLLAALATLAAVEFPVPAPSAADLARAGLDAPSATALVLGAGDSLLARLALGAPVAWPEAGAPGTASGDTGRFALGSGAPGIAIVTSGQAGELWSTLLAPAADALRDRRLLDLGAARIDTLEVAGGGTTILAARDASGQIAQVGAAEAEIAPPPGELERLAANLPRVEVTRFADETATDPPALRRFGLDPPHVRLRLRLSNGGTRVVLLGHADPEGHGVFAHRVGTPGVVVIGHATAGDLIQLVFGAQALPPSGGPATGAP